MMWGHWIGCLKPVNYPALAMPLKRALRLLRTRGNEALILKTDGNMVRVPLNRIYYIEIFDHNLQYHTAGRRDHDRRLHHVRSRKNLDPAGIRPLS